VTWQPPPTNFEGCNLSARTLDTSIARVLIYAPQDGAVVFLFGGRTSGSTDIEVSLGSFNAPRIRTIVTDSLALVRTIAHRGAGLLAPENTLSAVRLSARFPTPGVEFDVRLTKDSVPILMHDASTARTTGFPGLVADLTFAQIEDLNAAHYFNNGEAAPEPPPALLDVLSLIRYTQIPLVFAEVKHNAAFTPGAEARRVLDVIQRSGINTRIVVYSTTPQVLTALRALDPSIRLGYSQDRFQDTQRAFVAQYGVEFVFYPLDSLWHADSTGFAQLRSAGVRLVGFTAASVTAVDSGASLPGTTLILADTVPALFTTPLSNQAARSPRS